MFASEVNYQITNTKTPNDRTAGHTGWGGWSVETAGDKKKAAREDFYLNGEIKTHLVHQSASRRRRLRAPSK